MTGPVVIFVLVATAVSTAEVGGPAGSQTVGYYATAGECQMDLVRLLRTANQSSMKLDCRPIRMSE